MGIEYAGVERYFSSFILEKQEEGKFMFISIRIVYVLQKDQALCRREMLLVCLAILAGNI